MPEITLEEYELMNRILSDTRTGWWKADYRLQTYFFSKQIMELTGLPSDRLSFADFLNRIRTDFRFRIGEEIATLEQPYVYDMTFPILCPKGEIWIHIKKLHHRSALASLISSLSAAEVVAHDASLLIGRGCQGNQYLLSADHMFYGHRVPKGVYIFGRGLHVLVYKDFPPGSQFNGAVL